VALATALMVWPLAIAMALTVDVLLSLKALAYLAEAAVGVVPSVVKKMLAPLVVSLKDTLGPNVKVPGVGLNVGVAVGVAEELTV